MSTLNNERLALNIIDAITNLSEALNHLPKNTFEVYSALLVLNANPAFQNLLEELQRVQIAQDGAITVEYGHGHEAPPVSPYFKGGLLG